MTKKPTVSRKSRDAIAEAADLFGPALKRLAKEQAPRNEARCPLCAALAKRGRCPEHGPIAILWEAYAIGYADALALG